MKNKKILSFSILIGFALSFVSTSLYYIAEQLRNRIIFIISVIFLSPSFFLLISLAGYIGAFNFLTFILFFTSFIIWTLFIYFVYKLYNLWKIKKQNRYIYLIIILIIIFVNISIFGLIMLLGLVAESGGL